MDQINRFLLLSGFSNVNWDYKNDSIRFESELGIRFRVFRNGYGFLKLEQEGHPLATELLPDGMIEKIQAHCGEYAKRVTFQ